jgi:hypothetical protein
MGDGGPRGRALRAGIVSRIAIRRSRSSSSALGACRIRGIAIGYGSTSGRPLSTGCARFTAIRQGSPRGRSARARSPFVASVRPAGRPCAHAWPNADASRWAAKCPASRARSSAHAATRSATFAAIEAGHRVVMLHRTRRTIRRQPAAEAAATGTASSAATTMFHAAARAASSATAAGPFHSSARSASAATSTTALRASAAPSAATSSSAATLGHHLWHREKQRSKR